MDSPYFPAQGIMKISEVIDSGEAVGDGETGQAAVKPFDLLKMPGEKLVDLPLINVGKLQGHHSQALVHAAPGLGQLHSFISILVFEDVNNNRPQGLEGPKRLRKVEGFN